MSDLTPSLHIRKGLTVTYEVWQPHAQDRSDGRQVSVATNVSRCVRGVSGMRNPLQRVDATRACGSGGATQRTFESTRATESKVVDHAVSRRAWRARVSIGDRAAVRSFGAVTDRAVA